MIIILKLIKTITSSKLIITFQKTQTICCFKVVCKHKINTKQIKYKTNNNYKFHFNNSNKFKCNLNFRLIIRIK
jgi:hypothetical protein